ncbi:MAG: hypothetical protein ABIR96_05600 [Bdellovibrionota bacterium]
MCLLKIHSSKFFSVTAIALLTVMSLQLRADEGDRRPLMDDEGNLVPDRRDGRADFALSAPPSALVEAWGGWSYPFRWLSKDALDFIDPKADKYGYAYVRPNVRLLSSLKVNQAELRMDLYPLSFVGGTFGTVITQTDLAEVQKFEQWSGYDCSKISCHASNIIHFAEFKFKWALPSKFFGVFFYRRDWGSSSGHDFNLTFDPSSALPFKSDGDYTTHLWVLVGRKVSQRASLAVRYRDIDWKISGARRRDLSGVYTFKLGGPWALGFEGRQIFRNLQGDFLSASLRLSYVWRNTPEPENLF